MPNRKPIIIIIIESLAHTQVRPFSICENAENTRFQSWFLIFVLGHGPQTPNGQGLRRPSPDTALSALRRFVPPANRSGTSVPPSALPGNKADLWMHCPILWSGAATDCVVFSVMADPTVNFPFPIYGGQRPSWINKTGHNFKISKQ